MANARTVFPATERELTEWLEEHRRVPSVVITGAAEPQMPKGQENGTDDSPAHPPIVSLARLSQVISFQPRNLTIEIGAGMRVEELARIAGEAGLWLPASGMGAGRSTGGWIAAASPGAWDRGFGPVRRQLLACRMVARSGVGLTWGRAVMKNVAGYDLPRLMTGSRGRLGVLTRVTVRLWPRPESISAWEIRGVTDPSVMRIPGADAVTWHWSRQKGEWLSIVLVGQRTSVERREKALAGWVRTEGRELRQIEAGPSLHSRTRRDVRTPGSVVYRVTPGRRYVPLTFRRLADAGPPRLSNIEALPDSGAMFVTLDPARDPLEIRQSGPAAIERGGPADHEAAEATRDPVTRSIERRVETVFDAWPRAWQADYL